MRRRRRIERSPQGFVAAAGNVALSISISNLRLAGHA
jgi:hypothetical protein